MNQLGHTTTYTYTDLGWLDAVRDANGKVTQYTHDVLGRLLETIANARPGLPDTASESSCSFVFLRGS